MICVVKTKIQKLYNKIKNKTLLVNFKYNNNNNNVDNNRSLFPILALGDIIHKI